jgi:hypothetical protein
MHICVVYNHHIESVLAGMGCLKDEPASWVGLRLPAGATSELHVPERWKNNGPDGDGRKRLQVQSKMKLGIWAMAKRTFPLIYIPLDRSTVTSKRCFFHGYFSLRIKRPAKECRQSR